MDNPFFLILSNLEQALNTIKWLLYCNIALTFILLIVQRTNK